MLTPALCGLREENPDLKTKFQKKYQVMKGEVFGKNNDNFKHAESAWFKFKGHYFRHRNKYIGAGNIYAIYIIISSNYKIRKQNRRLREALINMKDKLDK